MFDQLEKFRKLPRNIRRLCAAAGSLSITAIIIVIWISVRFPGVPASGEVSASKKSEAETSEAKSPFQNIGKNFAEAYLGFIDEYKTLVSKIQQTSEDYEAEYKNEVIDEDSFNVPNFPENP